MSITPLSESTYNIREILRKHEATELERIFKSVNQAIELLINSNNSKSEHVLLSISLNVTSIDVGEEETENVVKKKSKKRPLSDSIEPVNKIQKIGENSSPIKNKSENIDNETKKSNKKCPPIETAVEKSESAKKCTPSVKTKNVAINNLPGESNKETVSKSSNNGTKTSYKLIDKINSDSTEVDENCVEVVEELEKALEQRIKDKCESERRISDKVEAFQRNNISKSCSHSSRNREYYDNYRKNQQHSNYKQSEQTNAKKHSEQTNNKKQSEQVNNKKQSEQVNNKKQSEQTNDIKQRKKSGSHSSDTNNVGNASNSSKSQYHNFRKIFYNT